MSEDRVDAVDLDVWLAPYLTAMGRKTRRHWAPLYLRGLLGPGDRKSLQPYGVALHGSPTLRLGAALAPDIARMWVKGKSVKAALWL